MSNYLLDTCILIDYFRGLPEAVDFFEKLTQPPFISTLTVAELYAGVREGKERLALDELFETLPVLDLNKKSAVQGGLFRRTYGKSHGVGLPDALLAATALENHLIVITRNLKHFPMLNPPDQLLSPY